MADFMLAGAQTVQIYIDPADTNYKGIRIAAEAFAGDVFALFFINDTTCIAVDFKISPTWQKVNSRQVKKSENCAVKLC